MAGSGREPSASGPAGRWAGAGLPNASAAPDCLQPTLVPRSGFRQQVSAGVRQRLRVLTAILLTGALASASATDVQVVVVRDGRHVVVVEGAALAAKLVALAESCSVHSTASAASKEAWASIATSRSSVRVVFPEPRKASLVRSEDRLRSEPSMQEIRLPLPPGDWPGHVFVGRGNGMTSRTQYDPFVLKDLVLLPELALATMAPYSSLLHWNRRP